MVATILINTGNIVDQFYSQYQKNANKLGWPDINYKTVFSVLF